MRRIRNWDRQVGVYFALCFLLAAGCGGPSSEADGRLKMGVMPKLVGIPYFTACERGANEAAAELDINLKYDGPAVDNVEEQAEMIYRWRGHK